MGRPKKITKGDSERVSFTTILRPRLLARLRAKAANSIPKRPIYEFMEEALVLYFKGQKKAKKTTKRKLTKKRDGGGKKR